MTEPENHTLALLREMRAAMESNQQETRARFDRIEQRMSAMHANGVKALAQFVGHRAMVERTMASFQSGEAELKRRVDALESAS